MSNALSILIPTYNYNVLPLVKQLHHQGLESEISFEINVYDDCSPDSPKENEHINSLSHASFTKLPKNIGRSAIRNRLAQNATNETLLFLDADTLPMNTNFISNYVPYLTSACELVFGGIAYTASKPKKYQKLRYIYGRKREMQSVAHRAENPHFIMSANLMIRKEIFLHLNTMLENIYGDDLVLSQNLKNSDFSTIHLDNPIIHLGLETSEVFFKKSMQAVTTIVRLEENDLIDPDLTKLQRTFISLRKNGFLPIALFVVRAMKFLLKRNLLGPIPFLYFLDLLKLEQYANEKKNG